MLDGSMNNNLVSKKSNVSYVEWQSIKKNANEKFSECDYKEAINLYNSAIILDDISDQDLGILYCNRSLSYLKLYKSQGSKNDRNLLRALNDANRVIELYPSWPKGYARLGQIYKEYNELELSIVNYEKSLVFDGENEEYKNSLADLKRIKSERARHEHLDPNFFTYTTEEQTGKIEAWFNQRFGETRNKSRKEMINSMSEFLQDNDPTLIDVFKAHEY